MQLAGQSPSHGRNARHHYSHSNANCGIDHISMYYMRETSYNQEKIESYADENIPQMTNIYRVAYNAAISAYNDKMAT